MSFEPDDERFQTFMRYRDALAGELEKARQKAENGMLDSGSLQAALNLLNNKEADFGKSERFETKNSILAIENRADVYAHAMQISEAKNKMLEGRWEFANEPLEKALTLLDKEMEAARSIADLTDWLPDFQGYASQTEATAEEHLELGYALHEIARRAGKETAQLIALAPGLGGLCKEVVANRLIAKVLMKEIDMHAEKIRNGSGATALEDAKIKKAKLDGKLIESRALLEKAECTPGISAYVAETVSACDGLDTYLDLLKNMVRINEAASKFKKRDSGMTSEQNMVLVLSQIAILEVEQKKAEMLRQLVEHRTMPQKMKKKLCAFALKSIQKAESNGVAANAIFECLTEEMRKTHRAFHKGTGVPAVKQNYPLMKINLRQGGSNG